MFVSPVFVILKLEQNLLLPGRPDCDKLLPPGPYIGDSPIASEDQQVDPVTAQLDSLSQLHHSRPGTGVGGQILEILHEQSAVVAVVPVVLALAVSALLADVESQPPDRSLDSQPNPEHSDVLTGAESDPMFLSKIIKCFKEFIK